MGRWGKKDGKPSAEEKVSVEKRQSIEEKHSMEEKHFTKEKLSGKEKRFAEKKHSEEKHFMKEENSGNHFREEYSGKKMECKDFEKRIPDFIAKKMDYPTLKRFCEHVQQCPDCREELDIQFLVQEGMQRLEEGNAFDLQTELGQRMEEAAKSIRYHSAILYLGIAMEIVAVGLLIGIVIWILL